jgi:hypothetical protein
MKSLDLVAIIANGLFLISYALFVFHLFRAKTAAGISPWFAPFTFAPYVLLTGFFLVKWVESGVYWHLIFLAYYAIGIAISIVAFEGWRRYR